MPWVNSASNGSSNDTQPSVFSARVKKRAYSRCRMACSTPPIYWSTGSQWSAAALSIAPSASGAAKRRKYQAESTKVSKVSVSRSAGRPQAGQATCFQVG